jgi:hypothetical protein
MGSSISDLVPSLFLESTPSPLAGWHLLKYPYKTLNTLVIITERKSFSDRNDCSTIELPLLSIGVMNNG